jgi:transposase-like protein
VKNKTVIRYSEAFKQQVIGEIKDGKYNGPFAASQAYGIKGSFTVQGWLRKYGHEDLIAKQITISTMQEQDEKAALKKRVRDLERSLSDAYMQKLLGDAYLKIACKRIAEDVDEFKKKHATKLFDQSLTPPTKAK